MRQASSIGMAFCWMAGGCGMNGPLGASAVALSVAGPWLRPEVVVEVTFSAWMADGLIRQASRAARRQTCKRGDFDQLLGSQAVRRRCADLKATRRTVRA